MNIIYESGPSGNCPVQAEGTIDGLPFYFRARGGSWKLSIAHAPAANPIDYDRCRVHCELYEGVNRDEPQNYHGVEVQFGAGWAEPDECRAFIEKAAAILSSDPTNKNPGLP